MEEVFHTPVLLSMLILCLTHREDGSGLPVSVMQLYSAAMSGALHTVTMNSATDLTEALGVMRRIASANMLAEGGVRREFTSNDLREALDDDGLVVWERLAAVDGSIPLVKTLEEKTVTTQAIYQFRHLSFQEALFAQQLVDGGGAATWAGWQDDAAAAESLKDPSLTNSLRIGKGALWSALAQRRSKWDFDGKLNGDPNGLASLIELLLDNTNLTELRCAICWAA